MEHLRLSKPLCRPPGAVDGLERRVKTFLPHLRLDPTKSHRIVTANYMKNRNWYGVVPSIGMRFTTLAKTCAKLIVTGSGS